MSLLKNTTEMSSKTFNTYVPHLFKSLPHSVEVFRSKYVQLKNKKSSILIVEGSTMRPRGVYRTA